MLLARTPWQRIDKKQIDNAVRHSPNIEAIKLLSFQFLSSFNNVCVSRLLWNLFPLLFMLV